MLCELNCKFMSANMVTSHGKTAVVLEKTTRDFSLRVIFPYDAPPLIPHPYLSLLLEQSSSAGGFTLNDKDCPGFTQLFRHPHPPRIIETKRDGSDALRGGEASARQHEDGLRLTSIVTTSPALINEPGYGASLGSGERSPRAAITASSVTETEPCSTHSRSVAASVGKEGEGSGTAGGKGGGASIFGVAFDDYIGEDGVCLPAAPTMTSTVTSGGRTSVEMASSDRGGGGEALASIEEDRRWVRMGVDELGWLVLGCGVCGRGGEGRTMFSGID